MTALRTSPARALVAAVAAACLAIGSASAAGAVLRVRAQSVSHELPPDPAAPAAEPAELAARSARGRTLFLNSCSHCHGIDARGDEGPDLHALQVSDRYIARVIRQGVRGEMPSFAKKLGAQDVAALIAYLRSLD